MHWYPSKQYSSARWGETVRQYDPIWTNKVANKGWNIILLFASSLWLFKMRFWNVVINHLIKWNVIEHITAIKKTIHSAIKSDDWDGNYSGWSAEINSSSGPGDRPDPSEPLVFTINQKRIDGMGFNYFAKATIRRHQMRVLCAERTFPYFSET